HRPPAHRKDVAPLQSAPHGGKPLHAIERGIAGIERAVQRADAGADHHVGGDAVGGERMQHADLDGAKTAAAGKHKGSLCRTDLVAHRHAYTPSSPRRQRAARGWGGYSSGIMGRATGPPPSEPVARMDRSAIRESVPQSEGTP